jgi:predicted Zn-dependent peptidase
VSVTVQISGSGAVYEPPELPGLAVATADMLREGTKTRTSKQIAEDVDRLGATLNAFSGFGSAASQLSASGLSDNLDEWMALATDVLLNPSFPESELTIYKNRQKATLRQQRTQPGVLANERYRRAVFGSHPAAVVSSNPAAIDSMTSEKLAGWHKQRWVPQNAILGIAGDVNATTLVPKLKKWFGAWAKTDLKEELPPPPTPPTAKKIFVVDRPSSVQTTLWVGNIAIDRRDPDYFAVQVMNQIVGGGPAGRLFINLRENKGYTYGYYSSFQALKWPGPWTASGDVRTEVTEGAITEVINEISRIRDEKVAADELDERKRAEVASFALSLEQPTTLLNYSVLRKIYGFPDDYWDTYPQKITAVTAEEVQRVARKYLNADAAQIVAVGEASKIKPVLEKFGPVEVWTTEGKPAAASPGK